MLDNAPFKRAINEQVKEGNCAICQESLSDTGEPPASFSLRTVVYASNCEQPHFMHTDCALSLVEHTSGSNLLCPLCRRQIGEIEPSRLFLQSLKNKEDQLNKCEQFGGKLRAILDQVTTSGLPDRLPELINLTKEASTIPERTEELTSCLKDAYWLLGKTFFERAQKSHIPMDINDALMHFEYCLIMSRDENKGEIQEYLEKTNLLRFDKFLDSARNNARVANEKLVLLEKEGIKSDNLDKLSPALRLKYVELLFIRAKEWYAAEECKKDTTSTSRKFDIKKDLKTAIDHGFSEAACFLAKILLKDAKVNLNEGLDDFNSSPVDLLKIIDFSIANGAPKTKLRAEKLKSKLPEKLLELAQKTIKSVHLTEHEINNAFEALKYAADSGTDEIRAKATVLLHKKQELIRDNQNIPAKKSKGALNDDGYYCHFQ